MVERVLYIENKSFVKIISPPYKSVKYLIRFGFYICYLLFLLYISIMYEEINSLFQNSNVLAFQILSLIAGSLLILTINILPLIISVFKNTFYNNLFLKEELILTDTLLKFKKNNNLVCDIQLDDITDIKMDFRKKVEEFSGVPWLIPNYNPTLFLKEAKNEKEFKLFKSLTRDEAKKLYQYIATYLINQGFLIFSFDSSTSEIATIRYFNASNLVFNQHLFNDSQITIINKCINENMRNKDQQIKNILIVSFNKLK